MGCTAASRLRAAGSMNISPGALCAAVSPAWTAKRPTGVSTSGPWPKHTLLHGVPQRRVDDGGMLTRIDGARVADLAPKQPVLYDEIQRIANDWLAAPRCIVRLSVLLAPNSRVAEPLFEQPHAARFEIRAKDVPHRFGLVDHQLTVADVESEGRGPAIDMPRRLEAAILSRNSPALRP